jgi:ADP-glucose pyrophosphorylase
LVYYGHTIRTLTQRLSEHQSKHNKTNSKILIDKGDAIIELVEHYPCENRTQASIKEGFYIKNNKCVNKVIPGRTDKEYRDDNKDLINKNKRDYYERNIEKLTYDRGEKADAKRWGFNDVATYYNWCDSGRPKLN